MTANDLTAQLSEAELALGVARLANINPDDGKYAKETDALVPYLSAYAEWRGCVKVQEALLETRVEFGQAKQRHLDELRAAVPKIDVLNISLLEEKVTRHDQLAVLEEIGRHVSEETKALLHPGTTSYDILDTARSYLLQQAWEAVLRLKVAEVAEKLCSLSETYKDVLQVGRTHLQHTSPVPFGATLAQYAARIAERTEKCDAAFGDLRGKISGIVGTGASIDVVIGEGKSLAFEKEVLKKLLLKPDYTATQIVQKERLCDVGNAIVTLMHVLGDFANDMRILYSSDILEVTSSDGARELGGSSADASKNNPINWENISGKTAVVESGMRVLYAQIQTDLQRDLRGSVQARYQPQQMLVETYEAFCRASKALDKLRVLHENMAQNLDNVRQFPAEAMVAITRAPGYVHPVYGLGHDAVKEFSKTAKKNNSPLLAAALQDQHFNTFYGSLPEREARILKGELELYVGSSYKRAEINKAYSRRVFSR